MFSILTNRYTFIIIWLLERSGIMLEEIERYAKEEKEPRKKMRKPFEEVVSFCVNRVNEKQRQKL